MTFNELRLQGGYIVRGRFTNGGMGKISAKVRARGRKSSVSRKGTGFRIPGAVLGEGEVSSGKSWGK